MYSARQFMEKLRDGSLRVEQSGHTVREPAMRLADAIEQLYELYTAEAGNEHDAGVVASLDRETWAQPGHRIFIIGGPDFECATCGELLVAILTDDGVVELRTPIRPTDPGLSLVERLRQTRYELSDCCFKDGIRPARNTIDLPSGKLLFCNFIREIPWTPEGEEYGREYDIGTFRGRRNCADFIAGRGAGYIQISGMVDVWQHRTEQRLVLVSGRREIELENLAYYARQEPDNRDLQEKLAAATRADDEFRRDYRQLGTVDCEMRRVMFADQETLDACGHPIDEEHVMADVTPGRWEFANYHDSDEHRHRFAGELVLVEPARQATK